MAKHSNHSSHVFQVLSMAFFILFSKPSSRGDSVALGEADHGVARLHVKDLAVSNRDVYSY